MVTIIGAIYEDGVLKPMEPLDLPDKQVVEIRVEVKGEQPRKIANLDGIWADYVVGGPLTYEEIEAITHDEHVKSIGRTLRQIDGNFVDEDSIDG